MITMDETQLDEPIEPRFEDTMRALAEALDEALNGDDKGKDRSVGFILMVYPHRGGKPGDRCNYISNSQRSQVVTMLKEQLRRFKKTMPGHQ